MEVQGVGAPMPRLTAGDVDREALDRLAALAARLLGAPSAHVALVSDVQSVLGGVGTSGDAHGTSIPVGESVCGVTLRMGTTLAVEDASTDPRVRDLPPVRDGVVGSYLGVPLVVRGQRIGSLCVYGPEPRRWTDADRTLLEQLAAPVVAELQLAALAAEREDERVLWQLAVDAAGVGAFDWDLATGELRWDDRLLELFGLDGQSFGGTIETFVGMLHPDDRDRVSEALATAVDICGPYEAEYRIVRPDGSVRWLAARGRALAGPEGVATRVLGAAFDTTAVQEGEARVSRVLEAMPTAFFQLDADWRFTFLNQQAHRLLGGVGDLVGGVLWDLFPEAVGSDFETHYREAVETGRATAFEAYYPQPLDRWFEVRSWPTPDGLSVYFMDVTDRREARDAVDAAAERSVRLASVSEAMTRDLSVEAAAATLARVVVGPWADWSVVTLVVPSDTARTDPVQWRRGLVDLAGHHHDPDRQRLVDRYVAGRLEALTDDAFLARVVREGEPVVVPTEAADRIAAVLRPGEVRDLCLELAPVSAVLVPLRARGRTVGALTVFRDAGRPEFSADDVADLLDASGRAALALDNLRLYAAQRDAAAVLQRSLLTAPPVSDRLRIVARYEPAARTAQVGGDWYDAFEQPDRSTSVVIGDVVGHDMVAAAGMGQVRGLLRGIAVTTGAGPAEVLRRVDEAMEVLAIDTTVTAVVARLEPPAGAGADAGGEASAEPREGVTRLRWSNAGHPPPLVVTRASESADVRVDVLWPDEVDLMLGLQPSFPRTESELDLAAGSTVLLYTDGLVEHRGQPLDEGVERLAAVLTELVAADLPLEEVCDELLRHMLTELPEDDVALVAVCLDADGPTSRGLDV